jgi:hypothetical protein
MNTKLFLLPLFVLTLLVSFAVSGRSQTVITFDELKETGSGTWLQIDHPGYQGLTWNGILCNNAILFTNVAALRKSPTNGLTGNYYGMVSSSNVVVLDYGGNSEIDSSSTNFNFLSAYLTGEIFSNLNIEVQGFSGTNLLYDQTVVASATNETLFTFNYLDINRLVFISSGGLPAFGITDSEFTYSIMDNFTIEFVPEPSSLLLATAGALLLCRLLKRKRA